MKKKKISKIYNYFGPVFLFRVFSFINSLRVKISTNKEEKRILMYALKDG